MPLRDRWNRVFSRKSISSSSSDGGNTSSPTNGQTDGSSSSSSGPTPVTPAVPGSTGNAELSKTTSRLGKTLTWRSSNGNREKPPKLPSSSSSNNKKKKKLHPSERPLTETNLKHQEMLSTFTMTFGRTARRRSSAGRSSFSGYSGVSPGGSRAPSYDAGALEYEYGHGGHGYHDDRRISSLAPPEEVSGEESERAS